MEPNFDEILSAEALFHASAPETSSNSADHVELCNVRLKRFQSSSNESVESVDSTSFVLLDTLKTPLELLSLAVKHKKAVLVEGPVGCGKSSIIQFVANVVNRVLPPSFVTVQLGEHMDSRSLFGAYQCSEIPGEFVWKPGPLTKAVCEGHWILLEDLNCASLDVLSSLTVLLESRTIHLPNRGVVEAHEDFRLFATLRTDSFHLTTMSQDLSTNLMNKNWFSVELAPFGDEDMKRIIDFMFPQLVTVSTRLLETFNFLRSSIVRGVERRQNTFREFLKWSRRIDRLCLLDEPISIFNESLDCFAANIRKFDQRQEVALSLASNLNVTKEKADYYLTKHKPSMRITENSVVVGRSTLDRIKTTYTYKSESFAFTRVASTLLEQISVCVQLAEPVLLVGETGCGKTMTVQFLARCLGKTLHVINMNQQSENSDLMGGFKPVDVQHIVQPLKERYLELFARTFSVVKNEKFLKHIHTCFVRSLWDELMQLMIQTATKSVEKVDSKYCNEWVDLKRDMLKYYRIIKRSSDGMMFSFVEGILTKALKTGDWVLLDEINLASSETLDCLNTILDSQSRNLILVDQSSCDPINIHKEFRLFSCMNPSTDVGKKELTIGLRNRFTEFFVDEVSNVEDLTILVESYLRGLSINADQLQRIVSFYVAAKTASLKLSSDSWGHLPNFSLRTLCRALNFAKDNPCTNFVRSLYEGMCISFLTELDAQSYSTMKKTIQDYIIGKNPETVKSLLRQLLPRPDGGSFSQVQGYWLPCGDLTKILDDKYILTSTVKRNLTDVARVVSAMSYPVLLQGETSVGKTSLIKYLAKLTGNFCLRINNHEHTDVQEYLGTYAADANGKLKFIEGPLVQAMKKGHWIILDELNLAPPDVLEALNRVLDDNRELFVPETQEVVKADPKFLLFATQNPHGLYGGRKQLSRAFRNRFVELHFNELPFDELEQILHLRCSLPLSYAKKMVKTMQELQVYRSSSGVFAGRESYMTLRDLFRWGERFRLSHAGQNEKFYDWDQYLADQGYLLLAGRSRRADDLDVVFNVLQKQFGRQIDVGALFSSNSVYMPFDLKATLSGFNHIVWTHNLRRSIVLAGQALLYNEPVLLIGETGCGKTSICQIFAQIRQKRLNTINCHMMTEAADFLGRTSPASAEQMAKGVLFEWMDGPLVCAMKNGEPILIDEISLADDSVLERLNSVLEPERILFLSEMGDDERGSCQSIEAVDGFFVAATMNPGGDYGKKELSRALRNRFTEIWCEGFSDKEDFIAIVEHNIKRGLSLGNQEDGSSGFGRAIFDFVTWLTVNCPPSVKLVITVRDVLSWVKFVNATFERIECWLAYIHGACVTFLDGLGCASSGANGFNDRKRFVNDGFTYLISQVYKLVGVVVKRENFERGLMCLDQQSGKFGADPFVIDAGEGGALLKNYSFEAPTCSKNVFRILRAMQIGKPILLEGDPGVGKSSLIMSMAKASGNVLTRINLSDQTDLSDLFGTDVPVILPNGDQGFAWVDGPLLSAVKNGHWVLIDEMNLASQSVLEGLNACFDHRNEIFIPQLLRAFSVNGEKTKFFACQNPFAQGAGRKGLPKSFINRFTVVFVEQLNEEDLLMILNEIFGEIGMENIKKMIKFNQRINDEINVQRKWGHIGSPWEFNLRDLIRWCDLTIKSQKHPSKYVELIYADRMRTKADRGEIKRCFEEVFELKLLESSLQFRITPTVLWVGDACLERNCSDSFIDLQKSNLVLVRSMLNPMRSLIHSLKCNCLTILAGKSGSGKSALVKSLATLCGRNLKTFHLNSETDSSDLLGCFEQKFNEGEESSTVRFSWIDSPLVDAVRSGDWLLVKNVHYCNPAVLDRLNALLEPDGVLTVTEKGALDGVLPTYKPHPDFRIFFTIEPGSKTISRAMRNRGVEIFLLPEESWINDRIDFSSILRVNCAIDKNVIDAICAAQQHLREHNINCSTSDVLKIAFIGKESLKGFASAADSVRFAFHQVLKIDINQEIANMSTTNVEHRSLISVDWHMKNSVYSALQMDTFFFHSILRDDISRTLHLKHFLWNSTPSDLVFRLEALKRLRKLDHSRFLSKCAKSFGRSLKTASSKFNVPDEFRFLPLDPRWLRSVVTFLERNVKNVDTEANRNNWNRLTTFLILDWFLTTELPVVNAKSLFTAAENVQNGSSSVEVLPNKTLRFLPPFFAGLRQFVKGFFESMERVAYTDDNIQEALVTVFYLKRFFRLCFSEQTRWDRDGTEMRLLWKNFVKSFANFLTNSEMMQEITIEISKRWTAEPVLEKLYKSVLISLQMRKPFESCSSMTFALSFESRLNTLNKKIRESFVDVHTPEDANEVVEERLKLFNKVEDVEMTPSLGTGDQSTPFKLLNKNALCDLFGLFVHFRQFEEKYRNGEGLSENSILPCIQSFASVHEFLFNDSGESSSKTSLLLKFTSYLNDLTSLKVLFSDFDDAPEFKLISLCGLPMIRLIVNKLFEQTFIAPDVCRVPLINVKDFQADLSFVSSFSWKVGSACTSLDKYISNGLKEALKDVVDLLKITLTSLPYDCEQANFLLENICNIENDLNFSRFCMNLGFALCTLTAPPPKSTDPVLSTSIKANLRMIELSEVEEEINAIDLYHNCLTKQSVVNECFDVQSLHPYVGFLIERKQVLEKKQAKTLQTFYRPENSRFDLLSAEIRSFLSSVQTVMKTFSSVDVETEDEKVLRSYSKKLLSFLHSADYFVASLRADNFAYPDIIEPFLLGVSLIRLSISFASFRIFEALTKLNLKNSTNLTSDELQRFISCMIKSHPNELVQYVSKSDFSNLLSTSELLRLLQFVSAESAENKETSRKCLDTLFNLYATWIDDNCQDDRYYEYKPKESNVVAEQEECEMRALFPDHSSITHEQESMKCPVDASMRVDEAQFAATLKVFVYEDEANISQKDWIKFFIGTNVSRRWSHLMPNLFLMESQFLATNFVQTSFRSSVSPKTLNVYRDVDLAETNKLIDLLVRLIERIEQFLIEWPENPILTGLLSTARSVLSIPANTPLIKVASVLENFLEQVEEWEKVASKQFKLEIHLQPLRSLLVEWRKIEVRGWERLLDDVENEYQQASLVCIMKFGLVLNSFLAGSLTKAEFLDSFSKLLLFSPLGEFSDRLKAVRHVCSLKLDDALKQVVLNYCEYFTCYGKKVSERLVRLRGPVEKELKEFLKIVKFQDLNLWRVKDTGRHSHRQLFKLVRSYKISLQEPVSNVLNELLPISANVFELRLTEFDWSSVVESSQSKLHVKKFCGLIDSCRTNLQANGESYVDITDQTIDAARLLCTNLMKSINYVGTKEENEKLYKRTFITRQKATFEFLDILRSIGFSYRKGLTLDAKVVDAETFSCEIHSTSGMCDEVCESWKRNDESFWIGQTRKMVFDTTAQKPHEQVKRPTFERCSGFARQMASVLCQQKNVLCQSLKNRDRLNRLLGALKEIQADSSAKLKGRFRMESVIVELGKHLAEAQRCFERTAKVWRCCPTESEILRWNAPVLVEFSSKLSTVCVDSENFREILERLENCCNVCIRCIGQFKFIGEEIEKTCGYASAKLIEEVNEIIKTLESLTPLIETLISVCVVPYGNLTFLADSLIEGRQILSTLISDAKSYEFSSSADVEKETVKSDVVSTDLIEKIFISTQRVYKNFQATTFDEEDKNLLDLVKFSQTTLHLLNCQEICNAVEKTFDIGTNMLTCNVDFINILERYLAFNEVAFQLFCSNYSKFCSLYSASLETFIVLMKEGYVKPIPDLESGGKEGETKFEDIKDAGMGEGEGTNDVSEEIKDLGQVDDLKKKDDETEKGDGSEDKTQKQDVDKPIEMEDDMDAAMEDLNLDEEDSDEEEGEEEEPDIDWKAGDAEEPQEEQLDPKLWDDRQDDDAPQLDDKAEGADEVQNELAAKDNEELKFRDEQEEETEVNEENETEEKTEDVEEDLENVNLEDLANLSGEDGNEEEDGGDEEVEKEKEVEETVEDEDANVETESEKLVEDKSQTTTKSISQSGMGAANDQLEQKVKTAEMLETQEEKAEIEENAEEQTDFDENLKNNEGIEDGRKTEGRQDAYIKRAANDHENEDERSKKRPRLSKEEMTLGDANVEYKKKSDIADSVVDIEMAEGESNVQSESFSHRTNLDESNDQVMDAASLDVARRQVADTKPMDVGEEKEVETEEKKQKAVNKSESFDRKSSEKEEETRKENLQIDLENQEPMKFNEFPSSIHTVMDFYAHATHSKELLKFDGSFDEDQLSVLTQNSDEQCKLVWTKYTSVTQCLAAELCENLRLTLEPTLSTKFQGDYRSGKRLNIRKLIPYIASGFRKNKIWLRRTKKAKRDYQIMMAVDDSSSMNDNKTKQLAFESLALLSNALRYLETGQLGVCKFGDKTQLLHNFYESFNDDCGSSVIKQLTFEQKCTNVGELLSFCTAYFDQHSQSVNAAASDLPAQLLLIISDGRGIFAQGMEKVKLAVQQANSRRIFVVFIVLDNPEHKNSILDIKLPIFRGSAVPEIKPYMEFFPFSFYVILRNINALPAILGEALRQWFEIIVQK